MFRKVLMGGVCAAGLLIAMNRPAHAQLAVFDESVFGQEIIQVANEVKEYALDVKIWLGDEFSWLTQAQQYATQLQQYDNEIQMFINWVHDPTLGGALALLSVAGLNSGLPVNPLALLGVINGLDAIAHDSSGRFVFGQLAGVLGSMSAFVNVAYAKNHIYTPTDGSWDSLQIAGTGSSIAGIQGTAMQATSDLQVHLAAQPALRTHLLAASSPKDVIDAQSQIDLETTWELNEIGQLMAAQVTYTGQQDSRQQRDVEAVALSIDNFLAASGTGLQ